MSKFTLHLPILIVAIFLACVQAAKQGLQGSYTLPCEVALRNLTGGLALAFQGIASRRLIEGVKNREVYWAEI